MTILTRGYGQTDRRTNRLAAIATYRAAIEAKNSNKADDVIVKSSFANCGHVRYGHTSLRFIYI